MKILADIEAVIDFTEEDLPKGIIKSKKEQIMNIYDEISTYINDNSVGEKIRLGFIICLLGKHFLYMSFISSFEYLFLPRALHFEKSLLEKTIYIERHIRRGFFAYYYIENTVCFY